MKTFLKLGTRDSQLALAQADAIKNALTDAHPHLEIETVKIKTIGDKRLDKHFKDLEQKSLFTKELDEALIRGDIDLIVHSLKDLPSTLAEGTTLSSIALKNDPRDAFVSQKYSNIKEMPPASVIGTASQRRIALIKDLYPHIECKLLRGNVNTRLKKLFEGEYDGIVLAAAGLKRLQKDSFIKEYLSIDTFVPSISQGILGITVRENDPQTHVITATINDHDLLKQISILREFNALIKGGCSVPMGIYIEEHETFNQVHFFVSNFDYTERCRLKLMIKDLDDFSGRQLYQQITQDASAARIIEQIQNA